MKKILIVGLFIGIMVLSGCVKDDCTLEDKKICAKVEAKCEASTNLEGEIIKMCVGEGFVDRIEHVAKPDYSLR